jgi:4-hydroxy 2-oxovalerate aldolase
MKFSGDEGKRIDKWVGYRPEIKILDCTVRDGGLINDCKWDDAFVKAIYATCLASGVNYMEMGYKGSKKILSPTAYGKWKFCEEEDLRRTIGDKTGDLKISVMADVGRTDYHTDILPKKDSVIDTIRVAAYIHQIPAAIPSERIRNHNAADVCIRRSGTRTGCIPDGDRQNAGQRRLSG